MNEYDENRCFIQGQLLRLSRRREVAIYLRDDVLWIADFLDGRGELVEPRAWFRFNCGTPSARRATRRLILESGMPLSMDIAAKIDCLHHQADEPAGSDTSEEVRL